MLWSVDFREIKLQGCNFMPNRSDRTRPANSFEAPNLSPNPASLPRSGTG
jgi:hypothetical protein